MRHILLSIFLFLCATSMAQDIELKDLKLVNATSANASMRKDINGRTGCLLRLQMKEEGAQFEGNILGDVEYKNGEYNIYMTHGSRRLSIKHDNYLPVTIVFYTLGTKSLNEGSEYLMTTKLHKEKQKRDPKKKGIVVFNVNPTSAVLSIDGNPQPIDVSGSYILNLPYGTHYYSTTYDNFTVDNQVVRVDKQPKQITVDLTEFCPSLSIDCNDNDAKIYTNNEYRGNAKWNGIVSPGKYVIQVRKDGFRTMSQTVTLQENQTFNAHFDKLKLITGSLEVNYEPIGADVYIDGKKVGVTPLKLNTITPGKHVLRISKELCTDETKNIIVTEDQTLNVKGSLPMTFWAVIINEAEKGDGCAMLYLSYMYIIKELVSFMGIGCEEGDCSICYHRFCNLSKSAYDGIEGGDEVLNYEKAVYWLKRAQKTKPTHTKNDEDEIITKESYDALIAARLCFCYAKLHNYDESYSWALKCFKETIAGKRLLAWHYYFGYGVKKDTTKALQLYPEINQEVNSEGSDYYLFPYGL